MTSCNWCFTLNNPSANDLPSKWEAVKDCIWQLEEGEEGTPHLQGFIRFTKNHRLAACKKLDDKAHWEIARDPKASVLYCSKESTRKEGPWTIGNPGIKMGTRTDLAYAVEELKKGTPLLEILIEKPSLVRLKRHLAELDADIKTDVSLKKRRETKSTATLRAWQSEVLGWLTGEEKDDRSIIWIYDLVGNVGKSWFADYLGVVHSAFVVNPGKKADIAHAYNFQKIVAFDCSRTSHEGAMDVVYGIAEDFKNGRIFSPKYESGIKVFEPPHVVFFTNCFPDYTKWSMDRYKVYRVEADSLVEVEDPPKANGFAPGFNP